MEVRLILNEFDESFYKVSMSEEPQRKFKLADKMVTAEHPEIGKIVNHQIISDQFLINNTNFELKTPLHFTKELKSDAIQLHFALRGNNEGKLDDYTCRFLSMEQNICYLPSSQSQYSFSSPDQSAIDYFILILPQKVFSSLVPIENKGLEDFARKMDEGRATNLFTHNQRITPEMEWIIRDIRQCQRTGVIKQLFLEAKLLELIMLQLELLGPDDGKPTDWKNKDYQKLVDARHYLEENFKNPPTIAELSRIVGLNEFKLKQGFKSIFNITIHAYVLQLRMQQAQRYILEGEKLIGETAHWVGYKNASHFTQAYKQYFGRLPNDYKIKG